jgi:hypothetical protein
LKGGYAKKDFHRATALSGNTQKIKIKRISENKSPYYGSSLGQGRYSFDPLVNTLVKVYMPRMPCILPGLHFPWC